MSETGLSELVSTLRTIEEKQSEAQTESKTSVTNSVFIEKLLRPPHLHRLFLIVIIIWCALLTPAAWLPLERVACPVTIPDTTTTTTTTAPSLKEPLSSNSSLDVPHLHHHSSELLHVELGSSSYMDNTSNFLVFCKASTDPEPLRWAAGVAVVVSTFCFIAYAIFFELVGSNVCGCGERAVCVLPLTILNTIMTFGYIIAFSIQIWFLVSLKRPDCPARTNHACALYRVTEPALILGVTAIAFLYVANFGVVCLVVYFIRKTGDDADVGATRGTATNILLAAEEKNTPSQNGCCELI